MATKTSKPRAALTTAEIAQLDELRRRNQARNTVANLVTVVMLLLTLLVLAWVAYQLNNPVDLFLFGHR